MLQFKSSDQVGGVIQNGARFQIIVSDSALSLRAQSRSRHCPVSTLLDLTECSANVLCGGVEDQLFNNIKLVHWPGVRSTRAAVAEKQSRGRATPGPTTAIVNNCTGANCPFPTFTECHKAGGFQSILICGITKPPPFPFPFGPTVAVCTILFVLPDFD